METNIGKVGTEAKNWITEEVVSKKKIWSLSLAGMTAVLLFAALVLTEAATIARAHDDAATPHPAHTDGGRLADQEVTLVTLADDTAVFAAGALEALLVPVLVAANNEGVAGYALVNDPADDTEDVDNFDIVIDSGLLAVNNATGLEAGKSYTFQVEVFVDLDTATGTDIHNADGGADGIQDDIDEENTATVTVYAVGVEAAALAFHVQSVIPGEQLGGIGHDLGDGPLVYRFNGLAPDSELEVEDVSEASVSLTVDGNEISVSVDPKPIAVVNFTANVDVDTVDALRIAISGSITPVDALTLDAQTFYVNDDVRDNHPVGVAVVTSETNEALDFIITGGGSGVFSISSSGAIRVTDAAQLVVNDEYGLEITVNGDPGIANRTTSGVVTVIVTGSNPAPDAATPQVFSVDENDEDPTVLLTAGALTQTNGDPVKVAALPQDDDDLTYSLPNAETDFAIDGDTGVISVSAAQGILAADGLSRALTVTVSDGAVANDKNVDVTITIVENQPVAALDAADLPAGVTYDATDNVYEVAAAASNVATIDDSDAVVFDLSSILSGIDDDANVIYTLATDPAPSSNEIKISGSQVELDDVAAPAAGETEIVLTFTVTVDDGFNDAADGSADATLNVAITVTLVEAAQLQYPTINIFVPEDVSFPSVIGTAAGHITNGANVSYALEGGSSDWAENFSIDSASGEITVILAQDFESQ